MKESLRLKQLKEKIKEGTATKAEIKAYNFLLKTKDNKTKDVNRMMDDKLTVLSGMKGAEKSLKDRIGRTNNTLEKSHKTVEKVFDKIKNRG